MKTDIKYSLASVAALLVSLGSCTTVRVERDEVVSRGDEILFIAGSTEPGTRAMLDAGSFRQVGNALKIFDIYSPTATWATAEFYIRDANAVCNSTAAGSTWPFYTTPELTSAQEHYYWTKMGSHRFYGVANIMAGKTIPADWKFDVAHKVFSVPATFNTYDTPKEQFDLIYSNIAERNLNEGDGTGPVALQFRHLFAGYAFTLKNDSPNPLKITSVRLKVGNSCTATINYGLAWDPNNTGSPEIEPEIEYTSMVMDPADGISGAAVEGGADVTIASGSTVNLMIPGKTYTGAAFPVADYRLIWPQQLDITNAAKGPGEGGAEGESLGAKVLEIKYEKDVTTTTIEEYEHYDWTDGTGQYYVTFQYVGSGKGDYTQTATQYDTYSSSSWYKDYKYIFAGKNKGSYKAVNASTSSTYNKKYIKISTIEESTTTTVTKTININLANITKDKLWDAGNRYLYNLVYSNDAIGTQVTVMNWEGDKGGEVTFE